MMVFMALKQSFIKVKYCVLHSTVVLLQHDYEAYHSIMHMASRRGLCERVP